MTNFYFAGNQLSMYDEIRRFEYASILSPFSHDMPYSDTIQLHIGNGRKIRKLCSLVFDKQCVFKCATHTVYRLDSGWAFFHAGKEPRYDMLLLANDDYDVLNLYCKAVSVHGADHSARQPNFLPMLFVQTACETGISLKGGISVHSSLVEKDGKGVLFLGPSGMGKSTQAKLWAQCMNADIINGDRPMLRLVDGKWHGFGMPWDGKDRIYKQKSARIIGMVVLNQADENRIRRISGHEAMIAMLNQAIMPMWDDRAMDSTTKIISSIVRDIPFYHLDCRPDEDAVQLTYKTVFTQEEV